MRLSPVPAWFVLLCVFQAIHLFPRFFWLHLFAFFFIILNISNSTTRSRCELIRARDWGTPGLVRFPFACLIWVPGRRPKYKLKVSARGTIHVAKIGLGVFILGRLSMLDHQGGATRADGLCWLRLQTSYLLIHDNLLVDVKGFAW